MGSVRAAADQAPLRARQVQIPDAICHGIFWTYLSAGFEIVGSFCIAVGFFARPAAVLLAGTMVNAIAFHLMKFGLQSFPLNPPKGGAYTYEPSLAFLGVTMCLVFTGPGRFALRPNGF